MIEITPEAIVQQQMLTSGQIDLALSVPLENVKKLAAGGKYSLLVRQTSRNYVGFFNTTRPPLDNALVRRALSYATPYKDIISVGAFGYGSQARGPVPVRDLPVEREDAAVHDEHRQGEGPAEAVRACRPASR